MSVQIGDVIALANLAITLYKGNATSLSYALLSILIDADGFKVAQQAPKIFGDLVEELLVARNIVWLIQTELENEQGQIPDPTGSIRLTHLALVSFKPLVEKYKKLGQYYHHPGTTFTCDWVRPKSKGIRVVLMMSQ